VIWERIVLFWFFCVSFLFFVFLFLFVFFPFLKNWEEKRWKCFFSKKGKTKWFSVTWNIVLSYFIPILGYFSHLIFCVFELWALKYCKRIYFFVCFGFVISQRVFWEERGGLIYGRFDCEDIFPSLIFHFSCLFRAKIGDGEKRMLFINQKSIFSFSLLFLKRKLIFL